MLLSLKQAAELLGYSTHGLRKLIRRGEIRFSQSRPGCAIKFRREWLDAFIDGQQPAPEQPTPEQPRKRKPKPEFLAGFGCDSSRLVA